jgi:hypothetical protein
VKPRDDLVARQVRRGALRLLRNLGYVGIAEAGLASGRRADILALDDNGRFAIVEIKSSAADFQSDGKWPEYLEWCDAFAFAVPLEFPDRLIPETAGLIVADAFDGVVRRPFQICAPLAPARRRALTLRFARLAASRLQRFEDPSETPFEDPLERAG